MNMIEMLFFINVNVNKYFKYVQIYYLPLFGNQDLSITPPPPLRNLFRLLHCDIIQLNKP